MSAPSQQWWTAAEIGNSGLPDLPATQQGADALAKRLGWRGNPAGARRRSGRGGGWEYHWSLFPQRARAALLREVADQGEEAPSFMDRGEAWAWFDGLTDKVKDEAKARLQLIQQVERMEEGIGRHAAIASIARANGRGGRTIWRWFAMIENVDPSDRLAYLAPRHSAAEAKRQRAECSAEFLNWLKADFLRLGEPSFTSCYDRVVALCKARGLSVLAPKTARRWMDENVPRVTQVFARQGERGLARCFPPQIRDRTGLTAMEAVNADCHKIDVFVAWPGIEKPVRPQIVAFQDLYSNKILSWQVDLDPNKVAVMQAFGEMIETHGIPRHCLFDNGREFANKWLTGGTPTRFRFKVREDDPLGVLPALGVKVHWATPAHGQAKPIERAFRDVADRIALDPRFAGAYVGNRPDAKPEDYGSRAIPLEDFLAVLEQGIRDHNARPGRRSENARGRSFDATFAESYATAPIRKVTSEQHRLWLMGQEVRRLHRGHGSLSMFENGYWADWMAEHAGEKVAVRFNPEDLHEGVHIYALSGAFMGMAECREKTGFFDLVGAKLRAKTQRQRRKAEKQLLDATRPVSVAEFAAELDSVTPPITPLVEAKVVEIMPARARKPLIERPMPQVDPAAAQDDRLEAFIVDFKGSSRVDVPREESMADRFWRALEIEKRSDAGMPLGDAEAEFWARYRETPEYRSQRRAYEQWGAKAIG